MNKVFDPSLASAGPTSGPSSAAEPVYTGRLSCECYIQRYFDANFSVMFDVQRRSSKYSSGHLLPALLSLCA